MHISVQRLGWAAALALVFGFLGLPLASRAQPKPIASVDTNMKATADLYECKRKEGVLTIKVRFKTQPLNQNRVANELRRRIVTTFVARGIRPYAG